MSQYPNAEKVAEEFEKRLLDVAYSATMKVYDAYKRTPREEGLGMEKYRMLRETVDRLEILRGGGPW